MSADLIAVGFSVVSSQFTRVEGEGEYPYNTHTMILLQRPIEIAEKANDIAQLEKQCKLLMEEDDNVNFSCVLR